MQSIVQRFWGFDRLLGPVLAKLIYYAGLLIIAVLVAIGLISALIAIVAGNVSAGLLQIIAAPLVGVIALIWWRFICELFMLAFLAYERLGEVRDLMRAATGAGPAAAPSAPDPNHPAF